jgi:hypothetical protein
MCARGIEFTSISTILRLEFELFPKCDIFFIILQTDPLQVSEISMNLLQMREH